MADLGEFFSKELQSGDLTAGAEKTNLAAEKNIEEVDRCTYR